MKKGLLVLSAAVALASYAGPAVRTDQDRVRTGLSIDLKRIGTVKPLPFAELGDAGWMIGCECLDRDYANFEEYKGYLPALGIKKLRLRGAAHDILGTCGRDDDCECNSCWVRRGGYNKMKDEE